MSPSEPIGSKAAHRGARPDEHSPAMLGGNDPLRLEELERLTDCSSSDPVVLEQLRLGGQSVPFSQVTTGDAVPQVISNLPEHRSVAIWLQRPQHRHSFTCTDE